MLPRRDPHRMLRDELRAAATTQIRGQRLNRIQAAAIMGMFANLAHVVLIGAYLAVVSEVAWFDIWLAVTIAFHMGLFIAWAIAKKAHLKLGERARGATSSAD